MTACALCIAKPEDEATIVVHSQKELVAALQSPFGTEQEIIIKWHRSEGITTFKLKPLEASRRVFGGRHHDALDRVDRHYAAIAKRAKALNKETCK